MNKRGYEFFEIPMWLIRMIYAIIVAVTVVFIVNFFIVTEVNVQRVDSYVTANALYYSQGGLAYYDSELDRVMPGTVVDGKINAPAVEMQSIALGNPNIIGARASILSRQAILNKNVFDNLNYLAEGGLTSDKGGPDKVVLYENVLFIPSVYAAVCEPYGPVDCEDEYNGVCCDYKEGGSFCWERGQQRAGVPCPVKSNPNVNKESSTKTLKIEVVTANT